MTRKTSIPANPVPSRASIAGEAIYRDACSLADHRESATPV